MVYLPSTSVVVLLAPFTAIVTPLKALFDLSKIFPVTVPVFCVYPIMDSNSNVITMLNFLTLLILCKTSFVIKTKHYGIVNTMLSNYPYFRLNQFILEIKSVFKVCIYLIFFINN